MVLPHPNASKRRSTSKRVCAWEQHGRSPVAFRWHALFPPLWDDRQAPPPGPRGAAQVGESADLGTTGRGDRPVTKKWEEAPAALDRVVRWHPGHKRPLPVCRNPEKMKDPSRRAGTSRRRRICWSGIFCCIHCRTTRLTARAATMGRSET